MRVVFAATLAMLLLSAGTPSFSADVTATGYPEKELTQVLRNTPLAFWPESWRRQAPEIKFQEAETGKLLSLRNDLSGRVVLVNFFATWCPGCRREVPQLEALYKQYQNQGFVVLGVNVRDTAGMAGVRHFRERYALTYTMVVADDAIEFYRDRPVPRSYLIDRAGRLITEKVGLADWEGPDIKRVLQFLLESHDPRRATR